MFALNSMSDPEPTVTSVDRFLMSLILSSNPLSFIIFSAQFAIGRNSSTAKKLSRQNDHYKEPSNHNLATLSVCCVTISQEPLNQS